MQPSLCNVPSFVRSNYGIYQRTFDVVNMSHGLSDPCHVLKVGYQLHPGQACLPNELRVTSEP